MLAGISHVPIDAEQGLDEDIDVLGVGLDPIQVGEQGFVAGVNVEHRQNIEFAAMLPDEFVLVRQINDGCIRLAGDEGDYSIGAARNIKTACRI
jgi:hypothetical protein